MAAQVDPDDMPPGFHQRIGHIVPHRTGLRAAMDQQHGRVIRRSEGIALQRRAGKSLETDRLHAVSSRVSRIR
ncbi:MAG: hypothetical protein VR75_14750 [Hyphomonadaceae bacterium BRH_c29]|nr:MAG: hypothetical protein VR75_14750 [Hyphomonadaceae bacterium BRH_c29]